MANNLIKYLTSIDLNQNELRHAVIENYPGDPNASGNIVSGLKGQILYDSQNDVMYVYTGLNPAAPWDLLGEEYYLDTLTSANGAYINLNGDDTSTLSRVDLRGSSNITVADATDVNGNAISVTLVANPVVTSIKAGDVRVGVAASNKIDTASGNLTLDSAGGTVTVDDHLVVTGDLTVNGTVTTINTEELKIEDNIIVLNSNVTGTPTLNSGIEIERGTQPNKLLIWDELNQKWTVDGSTFSAQTFESFETVNPPFVVNSTAKVVNLNADLLDGHDTTYFTNWTNITNKPDPTIELGGDLNGSVTLTDVASQTYTLNAYVNPNSVTLGTDTVGNYVATIAAGATEGVSGISVLGSGSETAAVTISHGNTSNLNGTYGSQGIADITVDALGHITGVTAGTFMRRFAADLNTSATSYVVNHNLNTRDASVVVREVAAPYSQVFTDIEFTDANNITVRFNTAPAGGTYRVVVIG